MICDLHVAPVWCAPSSRATQLTVWNATPVFARDHLRCAACHLSSLLRLYLSSGVARGLLDCHGNHDAAPLGVRHWRRRPGIPRRHHLPGHAPHCHPTAPIFHSYGVGRGFQLWSRRICSLWERHGGSLSGRPRRRWGHWCRGGCGGGWHGSYLCIPTKGYVHAHCGAANGGAKVFLGPGW